MSKERGSLPHYLRDYDTLVRQWVDSVGTSCFFADSQEIYTMFITTLMKMKVDKDAAIHLLNLGREAISYETKSKILLQLHNANPVKWQKDGTHGILCLRRLML